MKTTFFFLIGTLVACALAFPASAAVVDNDAEWPASANAESVDVHSLTVENGRGINGTRKVRQTFQVAATFNVGKITLSWNGYTGEEFMIRIFEVADIEAATWSAGTQVGSTITTPFGVGIAGQTNLEITLNVGEQFTLPQRNTGSTGYGMELESVGTDDAGGWRHAYDGTDHVAGRYYNETGAGQAVDRDMGLAMSVIPEPSTLLLTAFGMLGLGFRRRRKG